MRALVLFCLSLLVLGSGCSEEEGVLLTTSTEMEVEIDSLRFYVGENGVDQADYYVDSRGLDTINVAGRDLRSDPFKLLLKEGAVVDRVENVENDEIVVGVLALDTAGQVVGYGFTTELRFVSGKVLEWDISIIPVDEHYYPLEKCMKWQLDDGRWIHIGAGDDPDCDGFPNGIECEAGQYDPNINPDAEEICDNMIDDNCNEQIDIDEDADGDTYSPCNPDPENMDCDDNNRSVHPKAERICNQEWFYCGEGDVALPSVVTCYVKNLSGICFEGVRDCDDTTFGRTPCVVNSESFRVLPEFCEAYDTCEREGEVDPLVCVDDPPGPPPTEMGDCTITYSTFNDGANICANPQRGDSSAVTIPDGPVGCVSTTIVNSDVVSGWQFSLNLDTSGICKNVLLTVTSSGNGGSSEPLIIDQVDENGVTLHRFRLDISNVIKADCDGTGLSCGSQSDGQWPSSGIVVPKDD